MTRRTWLGLAIVTCAVARTAEAAVISAVAVSPPFFNPTLGQVEAIRFHLAKPGPVAVTLLDRDLFPIRTYHVTAEAGDVATSWDGRDDEGNVVPDEAYSLRIQWGSGREVGVYEPAGHFHPTPVDATIHSYSLQDGVLSYSLAQPSRVHAQAGQAWTDPKTKRQHQIVLKTLIDNRPRMGGTVVETWNGMADGAPIYVPDLPHFVIAVLATPLPPNTILAVGNRAQAFADYARAHRPPRATSPRDLHDVQTQHHAGLTALEDRTPELALELVEAEGTARPRGSPLRVRVAVKGEGEPYFMKQPTYLRVFLDEHEISSQPQPRNPTTIEVPPQYLTTGAHRIVVNWISRLGPNAVGTMLLPESISPSRNEKGAS